MKVNVFPRRRIQIESFRISGHHFLSALGYQWTLIYGVSVGGLMICKVITWRAVTVSRAAYVGCGITGVWRGVSRFSLSPRIASCLP
jgi:hypothetical protein